jgi:hypothetical protein
MPAKLAKLLYLAGESAMGYHVYVVELADGVSFVHAAGTLVIDLLNLPEGYTTRDVVNVRLHQRGEPAVTEYREIVAFRTIDYVRPE